MRQVRWIIQDGLSVKDLGNFKRIFQKKNIRFDIVQVRPFENKIPDWLLDVNDVIVYGSVSFIQNCSQFSNLSSGIFFNSDKFNIERYLKEYKELLLCFSDKTVVVTIKGLLELDITPNELVFIRPNNDDKSFDGQLKKFKEIRIWLSDIEQYENNGLNEVSKVVISPPYAIKEEWRLWIINGKVVSATQYRNNFRLNKKKGCPIDVIQFAESACKIYTPDDVFVMDICRCGDELFILECGGFNSAGFYEADLESIVLSVTNYFKDRRISK